MADDGDLDRWREGHSYVYALPDGDADADVDATPEPSPTPEPAPTRGDGISAAPVDRDYDWDDYVPTDVAEYLPHNGELSRIEALIDTRHETGNLARFLVGGPTGCGKTTLAEYVAAKNGWPLITVQGRYSMYDVDLLGQSIISGDSTRWIDGPITKALLASQERPVILLVDEANRARPEAASVLFSALDHRASVTLDERGGERIEGDPMNLITFATINEGRDYFVEEMDAAVKRRYGTKFEVDYLGMNYPEREAEMIADRTPASKPLARHLVDTANNIRDLARNDNDSNLSLGVPTSSMLAWANTAYAYHTTGVTNAVVEAAKDALVTPMYDHPDDRDEVLTIIRSHLDGAPFPEEDVQRWDDDGGLIPDDATLRCHACGWNTDDSSNDSNIRHARDTHECPSCDGVLTFDD
jgi:nitric oxide reductase NorQ protein